MMRYVENFLWFVFGGAMSGVLWFLVGCFWCLTIVGIPVGRRCFQIAVFGMYPFEKEVDYGEGRQNHVVYVLWLVLSGIPLALIHFLAGVILLSTTVGMTFGEQHFRLIKLALAPFQAQIYVE